MTAFLTAFTFLGVLVTIHGKMKPVEITANKCLHVTFEEEIKFGDSCEQLVESMYALEVGTTQPHPNPNQGFTLDEKSKVKSAGLTSVQSRKQNKKTKKIKKKPVAVAGPFGVQYPLFFPNNPYMTEKEEKARKRVCSSLSTLPGVSRRCCSLLQVLCPLPKKSASDKVKMVDLHNHDASQFVKSFFRTLFG